MKINDKKMLNSYVIYIILIQKISNLYFITFY